MEQHRGGVGSACAGTPTRHHPGVAPAQLLRLEGFFPWEVPRMRSPWQRPSAVTPKKRHLGQV